MFIKVQKRFHSFAIVALGERMTAKASKLAHKWENTLHLTYFGGLSTGMFDYKVAAAGCFVVGIVAMFPKGEFE